MDRTNNPNILIQRFVKDIEDYNLEQLHRGPKVKDTIWMETTSGRLDQAQQ